MGKLFIVLVATLSLLGCTTMKTVEHAQGSNLAGVQAGDRVRVTMIQGEMVTMTLRSAGNDTLRGVDANGKLWEIPQRAIESVEVTRLKSERKFSPGKTLGLGVVVFAAVILLGAHAFGNAMEDLMDDLFDDSDD